MIIYQTKIYSLPTSELNSKKAAPFSYFTHYLFYKKWAIPASFSFIFVFSNKQNNFYNKYLHVINVHPVYGAGI